MTVSPLERISAIAFALPEVDERPSHCAPCFFVRDKRPLCYFHDADSAADGRVSAWCPAPPGANAELVAVDPERFFAPTPSASGVFRDWIGMFVDRLDDDGWADVASVIEDAYRVTAPRRLVADLDRRADPGGALPD